MEDFFTYLSGNLMFFGCIVMAYGLWLIQKDRDESLISKLWRPIIFLIGYFISMYFIFLGGLKEYNAKILFGQIVLFLLLIFDIKVNDHRVLKFLAQGVGPFNDLMNLKLPQFKLPQFFFWLIGVFFLISVLLGILFLVEILVYFFWYF